MLQNIFSYFLFTAVVCLPLLLFWYVFSYIDTGRFARRRFFTGIVAGVCSVLPILYFGKFFSVDTYAAVNIFSLLWDLQLWNNFVAFFLVLCGIIFFLFFVAFVVGKIFWNHLSFKSLFLQVANVSVFLLFLSLFLLVFSALGVWGDVAIWEPIYIGTSIFSTLGLIIMYYILLALFEELSKYFQFFWTESFTIESVQSGVLYSIFIALGFSFFENILYVYQIFLESGLSSEFFTTFFLRTVFSSSVHIVCTAIIAYFFCRALLSYREERSMLKYSGVLFLWFTLSIFFHSLFNISLNFWFGAVIFIFFLGGYFWLSGVFFKG